MFGAADDADAGDVALAAAGHRGPGGGANDRATRQTPARRHGLAGHRVFKWGPELAEVSVS